MFVYYLNVPLNKRGIEEFDSYDEKMINVKTIELSAEEYSSLRAKGGLFDRFDSEFGTLIDVCEEERIANEQLPMAISLTEKKIKKVTTGSEQTGCQKVLEALKTAIDSETFLEIDIYLE